MEIKSLSNLIAMEIQNLKDLQVKSPSLKKNLNQKLEDYIASMKEKNGPLIIELKQQSEMQEEALEIYKENILKKEPIVKKMSEDLRITIEETLSGSRELELIMEELKKKLEILEQKSQVLKIKSQAIPQKHNYKKYYSQAEINALPMIEIDPLTNMFKHNPNVIRR